MTILQDQRRCPFSNPAELFQDLAYLRDKPDLEYSDILNAYVITRYEDIIHILSNPSLFSSRVTIPDIPPFLLETFKDRVPTRGTLLGWDNPDHDRLRLCVSSFFVPRRLVRYEATIRRLADELIDEFVPEGSADLKARFALPLPLKVVCTVVGIDPAKWEWVGRSLALFGGHEAFASGTFEEKLQGILDIHAHIAELIQLRKTDRRDDLISHIWEERDQGRVVMTDFEHLSMIPGLMLAGHETTTNLLSMGMGHLLQRGLWEEASKSEESIKDAIEELLRFESAITGMKREVLQDTMIGTTELRKGDIVFAAYNSGSRDPSRFENPDEIVLGRKGATQHLGFGRGIHACLGAPLARLLLKIEMATLKERFPDLGLVDGSVPTYTAVHEGRGVDRLLIQWDATKALQWQRHAGVGKPLTADPRRTVQSVDAIVQDVQSIAENVKQISLIARDGQALPSWTAGANIHVPVGEYGTRQYSLCSDPSDTSQWSIAVLREAQGTGGSEYIHTSIQSGMPLTIKLPRNRFALKPAKQYAFIAGGIGITPIRSMVHEAQRSGMPYKVVYLGSTRSSMAFAGEMGKDENVTVWPKDTRGRFDLAAFVRNVPEEALIYACGPARLLDALQELCAHLPSGTLHIEHFANNALEKPHAPNKPFDIVLKKSGRTLRVPNDKSILDILQENGSSVLSTCTKGTCGTCEVDVLEGDVEHRDSVLTKEERQDGRSLMVCVSRCLGQRLVLDLW